jgi:hypothetical protein
MKQRELAELTNEELLQEAKKIRSTNITDAVIIGFLAGVAIYSTVKNGAGLLSFLPLVYIPIAARNKAKSNLLKKLLKERNLQ